MIVAPHVGAWIEIADRRSGFDLVKVAPHVGAWIEINILSLLSSFLECRSSCRSVDWNQKSLHKEQHKKESLLM